MKNSDKLSHQEIMESLSMCFKELIETEISHRNMPNIINRGKAASQLVTAMHREQIMESKRQSAQQIILEQQTQKKQLKK
jgi:hypothetical protein